MKSTGIVRQIDTLGRIVLPIELRRTLGIAEGDPLEIFVESGRIVLSKYETSCTFCGEKEGLVQFKDHYICSKCIEELK